MPAQPQDHSAEPDPTPDPAAFTGNRRDRRKKAHHGADDDQLAARQRSEQSRSAKAAGVSHGRSYAFRRS
jgi:hypothetical protein